MRISKTLCKAIAEQIIAGRMFFAEVTKRLRSGVASALKALGREDLATDSNARPKDESEED